MKQPIAIISTDKHLKEQNAEELLDLAEQEIELALKLGVDVVFWLGDIFDSRVSQRQELLTCLDVMLDMYSEAELDLICIPGNHDKTDYTADDSFLTPYRHHPGFFLKEEPILTSGRFGNKTIEFACMPFYAQDVWLEKFKELPKPKTKASILFSHTAVQGSINNDGQKVNSKIQLKLFKDYGKVFLGHYHDAQQPGSNVFHLPSTRQNNFGEDENKGFTVLYDDLSFELVKSRFKPYRNIKVDAASITPEELKALAKTDTNEANVRVTLCGDQQAVKSIDKKVFQKAGIVVKTKYSEVEAEEGEVAEVLQELSGSDIITKFKTFCEEKGYNYDDGLLILKQVIKCQE